MAILLQIRTIRECLGDSLPDQTSEALQDETFSGPLLLRGIMKPSGVEEVLTSMPARPLVDLLVSRFFNSAQPSTGKHDFILGNGTNRVRG